MLHSLVHIESWATDLAWDAVARYGVQQDTYKLPREFFEDFVRVRAVYGELLPCNDAM